MVAACALIFWGLDDCATAEQVVIVEGEMDALALETAGLTNVLSVPNGAQTGAMDFLTSGETIFDHCHSIILAVDSDPAGLLLESELARRIGKEKCYRVRWPEGQKDANDVLKNLGSDTVRRCISDAEPYPIDGLTTTSASLTGVLSLYDTGLQRGVKTGWPSMDSIYTIRPGQMTIVTGVPGSGKSEWLDALMLNLVQGSDWRFGVFSPENHPTDNHIAKLAEKWIGMPFHDGPNQRMSRMDVIEVVGTLDDRVVFVTPEEPSLSEILDLADVLVFRYGIKGLIIDPWGEIEHTRPRELTETEYIGLCLTTIRRFAQHRDVHVWLVAHPRIMRRDRDGATPVPTPYDISGSAHWFNKADNCITIVREKENEQTPVQIWVQKVRNRELGRLGRCHLAYDRVCGRYRDINRVEVLG
jgi:twinkle protein